MRRAFLLLILLPVFTAAAVALRGVGRSATPPAAIRAPYDPAAIRKTIAFYEARVRRDPIAAIESATLAGLYLQRYRETGDLADTLRAEKAARRSIAIRSKFNAAGYDALAQSLLTQHRFAEALAAANRALRIAPDDSQAQLLQADIYFNLGDYDRAGRALRDGKGDGEDIGKKVVRARLLEVNGQPEQALALLRQAQAAVDHNLDLSADRVAWYHVRIGDVLAGMGRLDEAARAYREAVDLFPRDYTAMAALARVSAAKGDHESAIRWGRRSADIVPAPDVLALIGDQYAALGDRAAAARQYGVVEAIGHLSKAGGNLYDRQRALFCADRDRHLDEALVLARRELKLRRDIYAYDTLAWICYKKGLLSEADSAMRKALARGTQDARLFAHAARIARARGDITLSQRYQDRALALNPGLAHPILASAVPAG